MATRGKIGLLQEDNTVKSVYHHWDSYPEWLGLMLTEQYTDTATIEALLEGGDISTLESDTDWNMNTLSAPIVLYYKDRNENSPFLIESQDDFFKCERGEEYVYLFKNNQWFCYTSSKIPVKIPQVTEQVT
jgi:hypothetical protein